MSDVPASPPTKRLRDLNKQEREALFDELDKIEDDDESDRRYEELLAQFESETRDELAHMELPKELEDRVVKSYTLREFIPAYWNAYRYTTLKEAEEDYKHGRRHKVELNRNAVTAQAGIGFLCILTTLALDATSTYLDVSLYASCLVTPLLAARAYVLEKSLHQDGRPAESLISLRSLILDVIESVGLGVGILALIAHYSEIAAGVMAAGGVLAAIFTILPSLESLSEEAKAKKGSGETKPKVSLE